MSTHGLNLGQVAYAEGYTPYRAAEKRRRSRGKQKAATAAGSAPRPVGPMFELAAGNLQRPLKQGGGVGSTLVSSVAHGALFTGVFVVISMSGQLTLPDPNTASSLMAVLVAAPPPPPPPPAPAAVPASPDPAPSAPTPEPVPEQLAAAPPQLDLDLDLPMAPPEKPPELALAASPGLSNGLGGFGSGSGAGFGVEGGVGWGTGASGPGAPVRVGKEIEAPKVIHRVEPVYPPTAVTDRIEGTVVVEATVDEQGAVIAVKVLRSIGPLDQAAIDAVSQWRYSPLRVSDEAAQFVITVNVSFRLH